MTNSELKCVIIRNITAEQREDIRFAMQDTGHGTASQALLAACKGYARMARIWRGNQKEVERLREENRRLRECAATVMSIQEKLSRILDVRGQERQD